MPDRIDHQTLCAALVEAGQPLCVEHALRMGCSATAGGNDLLRVPGVARVLAETPRRVPAPASATAQTFHET